MDDIEIDYLSSPEQAVSGEEDDLDEDYKTPPSEIEYDELSRMRSVMSGFEFFKRKPSKQPDEDCEVNRWS
jgi:hypothetical protein